MLVSKEEASFDFQGARFEVERDREALGFIVRLLLEAEQSNAVARGLSAQAPLVSDARFLARQMHEERSHIKTLLHILDVLRVPPAPARLNGPGSANARRPFIDRCFLDLVLRKGVFATSLFAVASCLPAGEIRTVVEGMTVHEQSTISFGEERVRRALSSDPKLARHLLGIALPAMKRIPEAAGKVAECFPSNPVLAHGVAFAGHLIAVEELRLRRLGILPVPAGSFTPAERAVLMASSAIKGAVRARNPFRSTIPERVLSHGELRR